MFFHNFKNEIFIFNKKIFSHLKINYKKKKNNFFSKYFIIGFTGILTSAALNFNNFVYHNKLNIQCEETHNSMSLNKQDIIENYINTHPLWRSETNIPLNKNLSDILIFCGTSNFSLGENVAERLGLRLGKVIIEKFSDGEIFMNFLNSLRGKDVFIIQSTAPPVNDHLMELLFMISTCRRSGAQRITVIIPYYGYSSQDGKISSNINVSAADVAYLIQSMCVDQIVSVDLHSEYIRGFFRPKTSLDNLESQIIGSEYFKLLNLKNPVIISPDTGGVYRAKNFQERLISDGLNCGFAMIVKHQNSKKEDISLKLIGCVDGSDVIILDDMIKSGTTICNAARLLKLKGARNIYVFATHALFTNNALEKIENSSIKQVVITDSIKTSFEVKSSSKITILSISTLIADAIRRIHQKESMSQLFYIQKEINKEAHYSKEKLDQT